MGTAATATDAWGGLRLRDCTLGNRGPHGCTSNATVRLTSNLPLELVDDGEDGLRRVVLRRRVRLPRLLWTRQHSLAAALARVRVHDGSVHDGPGHVDCRRARSPAAHVAGTGGRRKTAQEGARRGWGTSARSSARSSGGDVAWRTARAVQWLSHSEADASHGSPVHERLAQDVEAEVRRSPGTGLSSSSRAACLATRLRLADGFGKLAQDASSEECSACAPLLRLQDLLARRRVTSREARRATSTARSPSTSTSTARSPSPSSLDLEAARMQGGRQCRAAFETSESRLQETSLSVSSLAARDRRARRPGRLRPWHRPGFAAAARLRRRARPPRAESSRPPEPGLLFAPPRFASSPRSTRRVRSRFASWSRRCALRRSIVAACSARSTSRTRCSFLALADDAAQLRRKALARALEASSSSRGA